MYVDDTALIYSGTDFAEVRRCLTEDLQSLSAWITQSKMKLNMAKSSVMWFRPKVSVTEQIPAVYVYMSVMFLSSLFPYIWG